eukprot:m.134044 g.134044  ORF g.134044 m.134044 type:complete len:137 (-) comp15814_c1_seq1:22-432(-)
MFEMPGAKQIHFLLVPEQNGSPSCMVQAKGEIFFLSLYCSLEQKAIAVTIFEIPLLTLSTLCLSVFVSASSSLSFGFFLLSFFLVFLSFKMRQSACCQSSILFLFLYFCLAFCANLQPLCIHGSSINYKHLLLETK